MRAALVAEFRKVSTTRLWWLLALVMFLYMAFLGLVMAFSFTIDIEGAGVDDPMVLDGPAVARTIYTLALSLGYVFPLVLGALLMTGEYRHRTIGQTLLGEPRRTVVLVAKLLTAAGVGLLYGLIGVLGSSVGGAPILLWQGDGLFLGQTDTWTAIGFAIIAMGIWCVIGVGLGTLLTNQVAAIVVILAFTQFVEPILRAGLAAVDALAGVARFLPGAAAEALAGTSLYSLSGMADLLARWQGVLVLLGYIVVISVLGRVLTLRRDIA